MEAVEGLLAVLAVDVGRDVVHGAGAVERHHGDDVLEAVRLEPLEALAHARAFELEHADRIGARQHLVALLVVEREFGKVDVDAATTLDEFDSLLQHRQRLEAEEVEFDEARGLDQFPVELGDGEARLRVAVKRDQFLQRPIADHHAGSVRGGMPVQTFQLLRDLQQTRHHRLASRASCNFGSPSMACGSVTGLAGLLGTSLQSLSTWP